MSSSIHPSAYIAETAIIGDNVTIGAFAVIEDHVTIGTGCHIGSHVVIRPYTTMGKNNTVHAHVVLGDIPQDTSFDETIESSLTIGDHNTFREGFTAHRGSALKAVTAIGSHCFFMNNSHVAHDCLIGDHTIFANNVAIGGFVEIGNHVFMGGNVVAHQFCRIGSYAIVQGTTGLNKDVLPFSLIAGYPAKHYRLNTIGLKRAGIKGANYQLISQAFRLLREKKSIDELDESTEIHYLKQWLAVKSKRGIHGFFQLEK